MEGKNEKGSSSSRTPNEQQRAEGSTQRQPSQRGQEPPRSSRSQGGPSPGQGSSSRRGMPPFHLHAIPVGGSEVNATGGTSGGGCGSIGGFATDAATRKRARDQVSQGMQVTGMGGAGAGGGGRGPFSSHACILCGRVFSSDKSLFGHMRSHRGRTWRGALPPPVFSREEFAETGLLNPVGGDDDGDDEEEGEGEGEQEVDQPAAAQMRATPRVERGTPNLNVLPDQEPQPRVQYRVPDLNEFPPEEGNGNDNNNNNN